MGGNIGGGVKIIINGLNKIKTTFGSSDPQELISTFHHT